MTAFRIITCIAMILSMLGVIGEKREVKTHYIALFGVSGVLLLLSVIFEGVY